MPYVKLTGDKFDPADYHRHDFYTLETGRENIQLRVSDRVVRDIQRLIESGLFEHYKTRADFVRDAVMHRLHDLQTMSMDSELMAELRDSFESQARLLRIHESRLAMDRLRSATADAIDIMRSRIDLGMVLTQQEDEDFWHLSVREARYIPQDQLAELRILLLYFVPSPADLRDLGRRADEHDLELWQKRQAFWGDKDSVPTDLVLSVERAQALGLMD